MIVVGILDIKGYFSDAPVIELELRSRASPDGGVDRVESLKLAPMQCAVVVVDVWNSHGCRTMKDMTDRLVDSLNRALEAAQTCGMQAVDSNLRRPVHLVHLVFVQIPHLVAGDGHRTTRETLDDL